jgi:hypothetical protein
MRTDSTQSNGATSPALVRPPTRKPLALVVFLENVGHIAGLKLPQWAMTAVDFSTEEYAKELLHLYGAYRRYDRVVVLEDAHATGPELAGALLNLSPTHQIDVLLLVHGHNGELVGYQGKHRVGAETFGRLQALYDADPACLDLRIVYGLNCFGLSLAQTWLALGAKSANGAFGVNWFPEPSLSVFLRRWLGGASYSQAVIASNTTANRWWRRILGWFDRTPAGAAHPWIESSRQIVFGSCDVTIDG